MKQITFAREFYKNLGLFSYSWILAVGRHHLREKDLVRSGSQKTDVLKGFKSMPSDSYFWDLAHLVLKDHITWLLTWRLE